MRNGQKPKLPDMYPRDLAMVLEDCWRTNPRSRPSFVEVCARLETSRNKLLRGHMRSSEGPEEDEAHFGVGGDYIKSMLEEKSSVGSPLDDEAEENRHYYQDDVDAMCYICEELLQHSDWVYRCEPCDLDVHALCAKYFNRKMEESGHPHPLTLTEYLPQRSLACECCNCEVRTNTWCYTCIQKWCPFDLHPHCSTVTGSPLCTFDSSHRLRLVVGDQRGFHCSRCGALGLSWFHHCGDCDVDIHLDCLHDMEVVRDDWNECIQRFMREYATKDGHAMMNMITQLLEKLRGGDALEASSPSTPSPPAAGMESKGGLFVLNVVADESHF